MRNYSLLKSISRVFQAGKKCSLDERVFVDLTNELEEIADYFNISSKEAFFLAHVFVLNADDIVDLKDLIDYFRCDVSEIMNIGEILNVLTSKGILQKKVVQSVRWESTILRQNQYIIKKEILQAVIDNQPMPQIDNEIFSDVVNLLEILYKLGKQKESDEISIEELNDKTKSLIESNLQFPLIKKVAQMSMQIIDTRLFLYIIWKTATGVLSVNFENFTHNLFKNASEKILYQRNIISQSNELFVRNLIEIDNNNYADELKLKLTEYAKDMIKEDGILLMIGKMKKENVIEPSKIGHKELFFNQAEMTQLDLLNSLLVNKNFVEMQTRLQNKNLPKCITVLLHGAPGTGKTESVYQIARQTGREIIKVDISNSKSMWFGESEKIIKRIFTEYKDYAKSCYEVPILLFNEADAIISKRKDSASSNVAQTENSIQNIILEELENFEGIFLATTNLVENLDTAFERRFLFKIKFQKPDLDTKAKIWKSKLNSLTTSECDTLATKFDFSGGQIDNIIRKIEMFELINGVSVGMDDIIRFCGEEILPKNTYTKIGFYK